MPVQLAERRQHLILMANKLEELGVEMQNSSQVDPAAAFEEEEIAEMLAGVAVGVVDLAVRTALRCGAHPRIIVAKLNKALDERGIKG